MSLQLPGVPLDLESNNGFNELVDRIYEAATLPEGWIHILEQLTSAAGGMGAAIFAVGPHRPNWISTDGGKRIMSELVQGDWATRNPRNERLLALRHPGFVTDLDILTAEEIDRAPFYTELLRPLGGGWGVGSVITAPSGDMISISVERAHARGPVERSVVAQFDRLRPHLARASLLSSQLGLQRAQAMAHALELVRLPAAVLGLRGNLVACNPSFTALIPDVVQDRRERVTFLNARADGIFAEALKRLLQPGACATAQSFPVSSDSGQAPVVAHVLPVRGSARDIFSQASTIVVVTPVDRANVPAAEVLTALFDLTPAEARIARKIGEGQTVNEIAAANSLSIETVRSQLKTVLAKTGVARQAELVLLLSGLAL